MSNTIPIDALPIPRVGEGESYPEGISYKHLPGFFTIVNFLQGDTRHYVAVDHRDRTVCLDCLVKDGDSWSCNLTAKPALPPAPNLEGFIREAVRQVIEDQARPWTKPVTTEITLPAPNVVRLIIYREGLSESRDYTAKDASDQNWAVIRVARQYGDLLRRNSDQLCEKAWRQEQAEKEEAGQS